MRLETTPYFRKGTKYSFTLNPNDELQFLSKKNPSDRLCFCVYNVLHILKELLQDIAMFDLYLEMSVPVESNDVKTCSRIHFHGTIKFKEPMIFLLSVFHIMKDNFNFKIDTIDGTTDNWAKYVCKDRPLFKPLCKKFKCHYNIKNSTDTVQIYLLNKFRARTDTTFEKMYEKKSILNTL